MLEIIEIINLVGSVIGTFFSFFNKRFQSRHFKEDFIDFKNKLETHFNKDIRPKIIELANNKRLSLEQFNKEFSSQLVKLNAIETMTKEYMRIRNLIKWIPIAFLVSLALMILKLGVNFNFAGINYVRASFWILIIGIGLIIYLVYVLDKLEKNITRFNLGEPIDGVIDSILEDMGGN